MKLMIIVLVCGWCVNAFAFEPIGTVIFVEGIADVSRSDGQMITLREGQSIALKDRVRTKSYSKVGIRLADESVLKLAPSSCVSIEEFSVTASGTRRRCVVYLSRGKAEAMVAKTGAPETFVLETPNARGSVKGSDIFVSYLAGKTGMFVNHGALAVVNPDFPAVKHTLAPGQCVFVPLDNPPEQPRQAMKTEMSLNKRDVEPELSRKWIPAANASEINAVLTSFTGTARIHKRSADDWSAAANGDVISEGDTVQTAEDSHAEIRMSNGNSLLLEPSTELRFTSLRYDPDNGNYQSKIEVAEGEVLAVVEKINNESTFEVRTPTAVSGVRGTIMRVIVGPQQQGMAVGQTQVFFEGGRGYVTSVQNGTMQQLLPGQNVQINAHGIISQPAITSFEQRSATMQTVAQKPMLNTIAGPKGSPQQGLMPLPPLKNTKDNSLTPMPPPPGTQTIPPPPPPPFDQFNPNIWYRAPMDINPAGTNGAITTANTNFKEISLKDNGSWNMVFNGSYNAAVPTPWNLELRNSATGDQMKFTNVPVPLSIVPASGTVQWTGMTGFVGVVKGPEIDRILNLEQVTVIADPATQHLTVDAKGAYNP